MANWGAYQAQGLPRFGSHVDYDDVTQLPLGLAQKARNVRYRADSVRSRGGMNLLLLTAVGNPLPAFCFVRAIAEDTTGQESISQFSYTQGTGDLYASGVFFEPATQLTTDAMLLAAALTRHPGLNPVLSQAFNRGYAAMGNLVAGVAPSLVYNPANGTLDPVSDKPLGVPWSPATQYRKGHVVCPSTFQDNGAGTGGGDWIPNPNTHLYQAQNSGVSWGTQPGWPTGIGATVQDGGVQWKELTPIALSGLPNPPVPLNPTTAANSGSPLVHNATAYVVLTYVSATGESINDIISVEGGLNTAGVLAFKNTNASAQNLTITMPPIPAEYGTAGHFGAQQGAGSYNVYAFLTTADPPDSTQYLDPSYYARVASSVAPGATVTISAYPSGVAFPTVNTAGVTAAGNVDTGTRYMIVLFKNRSGYITGCSTAVPVRVEVTESGTQIYTANLPIGPYNTSARICAFTVAGQSSTGPYYYISENDVQAPGENTANISITQTIINDNTTTSATFNFTDTFLPGATDVSNNFDRIEVPPASDIYFAKQLSMVAYAGCKGFPSGLLISDLDDPEAVRLPNSVVQVAEGDGDRVVCLRELREQPIALKENAGYAIGANGGDPNTWAVEPLWSGVGPVGPKAVAVAKSDNGEFMVFAHRSGLHLLTGNTPTLISREVEQIWERINWNAAAGIVVCVDPRRELVYVAVPLDGARANSHLLTMNYHHGWADPVIFAVRSGRLVPNTDGRKWSLDDFAVADMQYVPERYAPGKLTVADGVIFSDYQGGTYRELDTQAFDHNVAGAQVGFLSQWVSVLAPSSKLEILKCGGATISFRGAGLLNVYAMDAEGEQLPITNDRRAVVLTPAETVRDMLTNFKSTRFGVGFDNGGLAGATWEAHAATLWVMPWSTARKA